MARGQENVKIHDWFLRRDHRQRFTSAGFSASRSLLLEQMEHPCADVRLRDVFGFVWPLALSS